MDIFRVFDALNDVEQLEVGIKAVLKAGAVAEAAICYSGDSEFDLPVEMHEIYVDLPSSDEPKQEVQPRVLPEHR